MATKKKLPAPTAPSVSAHSTKTRRVAKGGEPRADPKIQAAQEPDDTDVIVRQDGRRLRRRQIYFNADTALRVAAYCAGRNIDMSVFVNALVEKALDEVGT